ncbi:MAG: carboxypeptidase regulatory-like domain-containing protein [Deltaproteobacteria bacterium]|nr:carboxypeptidase regulatory-like domain-containing protein [Deltaproteobacteria bacterium]
MKKYFLLFAVAILAAGYGCEKGDQGASSSSLTGHVLELGTGVPIPSALITTSPLGMTATTGPDGGFALSPLPIGSYKLTSQAAGYISQTTDFVLVTSSGMSGLDLYLSKYPATSMVIANAGSDRYSVGYGSPVELSAQASSSYDGSPIAYQWVQVAGPAVALLSGTTSAPVFTTLPMDRLVDIPDHFGLLGITPSETGSYTFAVYATANGFSDSATVTVSSSQPKPVITDEAGFLFSNETVERANVPAGAVVYLNGGIHTPSGSGITSYLWTFVSTPPSSAAAFDDPSSQTPSFVPDMSGDYVIDLAAGTGSGTVNELFTVTASSYVGAKDCELCHNGSLMTDLTTGYSTTGHASAFDALGAAYSVDESCLQCHTTGFDKTATAANGGFDDIARDLGWTVAVPVSYQSLPAGLQAMANVGCESCHGPGGVHTGSYSFDTSVCAQCHDNAPFDPEYTQWLGSPHAQSVSPAGMNLAGSGFTTCRACHWSLDIVDTNMEGNGMVPFVTSNEQPVNCIACHDPHSGASPYSLRVYADVAVAGGSFTVTDVGEGAVCMKCHTDSTASPDTSAGSGKEPRYTTAEVFAQGQGFTLAGAGAYASSITESSYHAGAGDFADLCVTCHMAQTPAPGQPGYDTTGEHTFMMTDAAGDDHVAVCDTCHAGSIAVSGFDTVDPLYPTANWDGDPTGATEGVQDQVHGLLSVLACAITTGASQSCTVDTTDIDGGPVSWTITIPATRTAATASVSLTGTTFAVWPTATTQERDAVYNWYVVDNEGSYGIHNTAFDVMLLQKAFKDLTGSDIPGATIRQ